MDNMDNMDNIEKPNIELGDEGNKENLKQISLALNNKDMDLLRVTIDSLQDAVDPKKMCSRMANSELQELIQKGKTVLCVGTGSAGDRIFIEHGRLYMPVSEDDLKYGHGKRCQDNFRKLFNIPEGQELSVNF